MYPPVASQRMREKLRESFGAPTASPQASLTVAANSRGARSSPSLRCSPIPLLPSKGKYLNAAPPPEAVVEVVMEARRHPAVVPTMIIPIAATTRAAAMTPAPPPPPPPPAANLGAANPGLSVLSLKESSSRPVCHWLILFLTHHGDDCF